MAIPDKPLVIDLATQKLTLGEICLFAPRGFDVLDFRDFIVRRTNWTREEFNAIEPEELEEVAKQIRAKLEEGAVPLVSKPNSAPGLEAKATASPLAQT